MKLKFLLAGFLSLLLAWSGPLPLLSQSAFYAHMIMHMLVVAVASPLLALGIAEGPWDISDRFPLTFSPLTASVGELIIVWGWHAPSFHMIARHTTWGLVLEQSSFLLVGVWLWLSAIRFREAGVVGLLLTSMHMTFLGALLGLATRSLYAHHEGVGDFTALEDQQLGGAIMLVIGGISYLTGGLWLTAEILKERRHEKVV